MFFREVCEIFESTFFTEPSGDCILTSGGCFCIFFKKVILNSYFATLLWRTNNFFFSTHRLMYKKSNSFVYKFVVNCQVFEITPSGCTLWSWKLACLITWTIPFETPFFRYLSMCGYSLQSWTKGCIQIHEIKENRFFYGMFCSCFFYNFLPKSVKIWLLIGWLDTRHQV